MSTIRFKRGLNDRIAYCIIDRIYQYSSSWTKELIKNQADFSISNTYSQGYDIFQFVSEDVALRTLSDLNYQYAVVFSTGTEFINGDNFFKNVEEFVNKDFFIAGHILDRGEAYYELHSQCFIVNLDIYQKVNYPAIGEQVLGESHLEYIPIRSDENFHDNYTPTWVASQHIKTNEYAHKCHGWNILKTAFDNNLKIEVFDDSLRNNKKHFYPENQKEFIKHISWAYQRESFCAEKFVHTETTDHIILSDKKFKQFFTPASGLLWVDLIDATSAVSVVVYDYNQQSLNYWRDNAPKISNVEYKFVNLDIVHEDIDLAKLLDLTINETFINLSNIFSYEGTMFLTSLEYRLSKENKLLSKIKKCLPEAIVYSSIRSCSGFTTTSSIIKASDFVPIELKNLITPTWHSYDWI